MRNKILFIINIILCVVITVLAVLTFTGKAGPWAFQVILACSIMVPLNNYVANLNSKKGR